MSEKKDVKAGVQQVVQELYEQHGEVWASGLVEAARPKESPAHGGFEWNNKKAADEYRLEQARRWIRVVTVEREDRQERLVHVSAASSETREGSYKAPSQIAESPDEFQRALSEAMARLAAARRSVDDLERAARRADDTEGRAAMIAQIAETLGALQAALDRAVH